jgi:hypothetical protein
MDAFVSMDPNVSISRNSRPATATGSVTLPDWPSGWPISTPRRTDLWIADYWLAFGASGFRLECGALIIGDNGLHAIVVWTSHTQLPE